MMISEVRNLAEGAHIVSINGLDCLIARLPKGFIMLSKLTRNRVLVQRYSENGHVIWENCLDELNGEIGELSYPSHQQDCTHQSG